MIKILFVARHHSGLSGFIGTCGAKRGKVRLLRRRGTTIEKTKKRACISSSFPVFLGHLWRLRKRPFFQKHLFTVGKPKQIGEHPIPGAKRVLFADIAVNQ